MGNDFLYYYVCDSCEYETYLEEKMQEHILEHDE